MDNGFNVRKGREGLHFFSNSLQLEIMGDVGVP